MREISIEVKSTLNVPSAREVKADVGKLREHRRACQDAVKMFNRQIDDQRMDKLYMERLAENPVGDDGIRYNADACANAAKRCDRHIGMFESMIKNEQTKIGQLDYMITEIEKQLCLSEQMSQSTGN